MDCKSWTWKDGILQNINQNQKNKVILIFSVYNGQPLSGTFLYHNKLVIKIQVINKECQTDTQYVIHIAFTCSILQNIDKNKNNLSFSCTFKGQPPLKKLFRPTEFGCQEINN